MTIVVCATWSRPFSVNDRGLSPWIIVTLGGATGDCVGVTVRLTGVPGVPPAEERGVPDGVANCGAAGPGPAVVATVPGTGVLAGGGAGRAGSRGAGGP